MTLVFGGASATPAIHVLIVAVDEYPWLTGGPKVAEFPRAQECVVGQLDSPGHSAQKMAHAFLSQKDTSAIPLGSIAMLASSSACPSFTVDGVPTALERATWTNLTKAVEEWRERANSHADNIAVFYFAGHGYGVGQRSYLLTESFGSRPNAMLQDTLQFETFQTAMEECAARNQLFLLDCCRSATPNLITQVALGGGQGGIILQQSGQLDASLDLKTAVLRPTRANDLAYAPEGEPSYFAQAFEALLRGAGWDIPSDGTAWNVRTSLLGERLTSALAYIAERDQVSLPVPQSVVTGAFVLCQPNPTAVPVVPVTLGREPRSDNSKDAFVLTPPGEASQTRKKGSEDWFVELAAKPGYQFSSEGKTRTFDVRPPVLKVRI